MMQTYISKLFWTVGISICFASTVLGQTASLTLTGAAGLSPGVLAGVYTSPYLGTVVTGGNTETNVKIICDDFTSETYFDETWTAYVTTLPTISDPAKLKWDGYYSSTDGGTTWNLNNDQATGYTIAAYLATQILQAQTATQQADLSFALWGLFDAQDPAGPFTTITAPDLNNAKQLLLDAETAVHDQGLTLSNYSNVTIYSYDAAAGAPTCPSGSCPPPPQEFLRVAMAEPSYPAILAIDLLAVVGLMVVFRRRITSILN